VVVNLTLASPVCVRYGLENHVCEVQLLLRAFAEALTPERHERYVKFRQRHRPTAVNLSWLSLGKVPFHKTPPHRYRTP
jgi:hypothetical protein